MNRFELGRAGEQAAMRMLRKKGARVLARNYETQFGEIDLIVRLKDVIAFVEVKTRTTDAFGAPSEAVDARKQAHIAKSAMRYIKDNALGDFRVRFDVVEVTPDAVNHIEDAFFVFNSKYM